MTNDQEAHRPYEALAVGWLAISIAVGSVIVHFLARWTGGASGGNAGPAALLGLLALVFEIPTVIGLALPGFLLAWRALRQGPPRADAALALVLVLWTPAWLVAGSSLIDGWPADPARSTLAVVTSALSVAAALGTMAWLARRVAPRWCAVLIRGAAVNAVAVRCLGLHPAWLVASVASGWALAGLSAFRPRHEPCWMAGVNALSAAVIFLSVVTSIDDPGVMLAAAVLTGLAGPVGGLLLMLQAPRAARRWPGFVVRGLIGSIAIAELAHFLPSRLGDAVAGVLVGVALSACWTALALQSSRAERNDPPWLRLLTVVVAVAVVTGPILPAPLFLGLAALAAGIVLMAQAPKTARRWFIFWLRGLIGSLAIAELAFALRNSLGDVAAELLAGLALVACWVANALACSGTNRRDPRWLRLLTIATGIAVILWPLVLVVVSVVSEGNRG